MDISELESFKLSDAIAFHDKLNPKLFIGQRLRPDVEKQLKIIADDFLSELGISELDVIDITISGSNAAYSYTKHSDLDLHIIVDMSKLSNDEVYRELFNAKKNLYNDSHDIKIHSVPIELYVQDSNEPVKSLGEYSLLNKKWLKIPTKRRANLNQAATRLKYEKLHDLIELALKSVDLSKISEVLRTIKRYRQVGLEKGGEFSPENLAYKVLRTQGLLTRLYAMRDKLHSKRLSIEGMYVSETRWTKPTKKFKKLNEELNHVLNLDIHWNKKIELLEALGKQSIISEVLDDNTVRRVKGLVDSFTAKRLRVGKRYIPVPVTILHNEVMFHDIDKNFPPRVPAKFGTLVDISVDDMKLKFDHDEVTYPISEYRTVAAMTVIFVDTIEQYEKLRTYVSLTFDISLPNLKQITDEDYDPNGPPPGPETKPTMPKGTVRVDVSDVYDWYKLGQNISNLDRVDKNIFGKGPPSTIMAFGSEDEEHKYINQLKNLGLDTTDIDPVDPKQPKGMKRQKVDPTYNVNESKEIHNYLKLDNILQKLTQLIIKGQESSNDYGMVGACIVDPDNRIVSGLNSPSNNGKRIHAERVAIEKYENKYGPIPEESIVITTLSPCNESDDETAAERVGESCTDYLNSKGIKKVYCGYMDPTQDNDNREFNIMETSDKDIRYKCKQFADTFLKKDIDEDSSMRYAAEKTPAINPYGGLKDNQYRGGISEASGYIPSEKEKNDPRWKTALTVDIKPDTMKKDAKKFGNKISRAGIPPLLKASGKLCQ